jgi:hypothetical protein
MPTLAMLNQGICYHHHRSDARNSSQQQTGVCRTTVPYFRLIRFCQRRPTNVCPIENEVFLTLLHICTTVAPAPLHLWERRNQTSQQKAKTGVEGVRRGGGGSQEKADFSSSGLRSMPLLCAF